MLYVWGDDMYNEMKIGFYIKSINNILDKKANEMLNSIGITKSQVDILFYIYFSGKSGILVTQRDIEKEFNISNPTVTGILNRLEEKGFIKRVINEQDSRYKNIITLDKFNNIALEVKKRADEGLKRLFEGISVQDRKLLNDLLGKLYDNLCGGV